MRVSSSRPALGHLDKAAQYTNLPMNASLQMNVGNQKHRLWTTSAHLNTPFLGQWHRAKNHIPAEVDDKNQANTEAQRAQT